MKQAVKSFIGKLVESLKAIYEQNKLYDFRHNPNITIEAGLTIESYFSANLPEDKFSIKFGSHVRIKKYCHILMFPGAALTIGSNVFFNNYCSINCLEKISIGENTMFGEGVKLYDHNHLFGYKEKVLEVSRDQFQTAPVTIGKNCWIGSNVAILKGVTIGDNVIVGANCLVYKSVESNTVIKAKSEYIIESSQN
ncbi:acyltransferase [Mucilaginibacter xinganensis]|uniref:Transferase hexapeptide (Six repeat-containing protein) n=1 Tax=Mucilaginibacter xinganensis TaxID=1234841 RepID=A0A223P3Y4_9SPHI|nr:acyltransferase [Mucilaginibacter xinganensis]ASU36802.1 transferase hexapeptide (six repeat-containing protein) [Mucilaginibacter xinganensis]